MVVERLVNAEGGTRHDYGRKDFINRVWQWKEESGGMITRQLRRMGASPDWAHERFTMDEGLSAAVSEVFVRGAHLVSGGRCVTIDEEAVLREVAATAERIAGRLDMDRIVKLAWPVE